MPDADEHRRLGKREADKAGKLQDGTAKDARLQSARDHEADAHSRDWRDSNLHAPK
jgi:hypothetical protein